MTAYVQDSNWISRRAIVFVAIIGLHILVIYAFASGLANNGAKYVATIIETNFIAESKPKDLPPPPPPVELKERPPVQVVVPELNISVPAEAPPPPITYTTTAITPPPPPRAVVVAPPTPPVRTYMPSTEERYPPASIRASEEGRPEIKLCIGPNGRVDDVTLVKSSGFPRLDEAAVGMGKEARFKPAMQGGKPVAMCVGYAIKFVLKEAR
jgi:protein TonB